MISSRTPEGIPNECPVCRSEVCLEPSLYFGDAPCPRCGTLLWFVALPDETLWFEYEAAEEARDLVTKLFAERLGVTREALAADPALQKELGLDSLDVVELVMELEELLPTRSHGYGED